MTTLLFIHGTGVREPQYSTALARIKAGFSSEHVDIDVQSCYWGEIGAELHACGKSFYFDPLESADEAGGSAAGHGHDQVPEEEKELARWARLMDDPCYEIRLREMAPVRGRPYDKVMKRRVLELPAKQDLAGQLAVEGLTEVFAAAVEWLTMSDEFMSVLGNSTAPPDGSIERMLSRALVARCLATLAETGVDLVGERRDKLVLTVQRGFGVADYGPLDPAGNVAKNIAFRAAGSSLRRRRHAAIKQLADILLYQAHGNPIRGFVRDRIRETEDDRVVLLAHSLGGVIAFDMLAEERATGLDRVRMLVTVGSQVPLLYELRALTCGVNFGTPLPDSFKARWLNAYDKRDLLAYGGEELFGKRCQDIPVDTKTPFPTAHGAYWDKKSGLFKELTARMQGVVL